MIKFLFCDIDGTLTKTISGKPFKEHSEDILVLNKEIRGALIYYLIKGYTIVGISNQGGCDSVDITTGKPFKTIESAITEMANTIKLLPMLDSIYFCPCLNGSVAIRVRLWKEYNDVTGDTYISTNTDKYSNRYSVSDNTPVYSFRKPDIGMVKLAIDNFYEESYLNVFNSLSYKDFLTYEDFTEQVLKESIFVGDRDEDEQCAKKLGIKFIDAIDFIAPTVIKDD